MTEMDKPSLRIRVDREKTRLDVTRGSVRLKSMLDGRTIDVVSGQYVVAAAGVELETKPLSEGPRAVDAIARGIGWLKSRARRLQEWTVSSRPQPLQYHELVLWTFLHAGVPEDDPHIQMLLENILGKGLQATYTVALQAMILDKLDRVKYQGRIRWCAQFLVDNQCENGQWSYGEPSPLAEGVPAGIQILKMREGPKSGDNSNTLYAVLGLRACLEGGIPIDPDVLRKAKEWWTRSQLKDGGWGYKGPGEREGAHSSGSMTAGGIAGLCILEHSLREDYKSDPNVLRGLDWLAKNFHSLMAPRPEGWLTYYLHALQEAGTIYGTEHLGSVLWYPDAADYLLHTQKESGLWDYQTNPHYIHEAVVDTCFAILFLSRSSRALGEWR